MAEKTKLTTADFSNVWKDNQNTLPSGLKLDFVEHLQRQRLSPEWVQAKENLVQIMNLEQFDPNKQIEILDIGCGLGIDLFLVADEAIRLNRQVVIVGFDQNSTMINEAKLLYEKQKHRLTSNITIEIQQGDILSMNFADSRFDIVRSDITLQHVDIDKALPEIYRVLKPNGRLIALEGGAGNLYSSDEELINIYDSVLPSRRDGGIAIRLQFLLPKFHFQIKSLNPKAFIQSGLFLASQDKDWIKLRGMGEMLIQKDLLTKEQSEAFQERYKQACETNNVLGASILFIIEAMKLDKSVM